ASAHGELDHRTGHGEGVEAEVALRERIVAGSLEADVLIAPDADGALRQQLALEIGHEFAERPLSADQKAMRMPRLPRARPATGVRGQPVALEHQHALEEGRQRRRGRKPADSGTNDDGLPTDGCSGHYSIMSLATAEGET